MAKGEIEEVILGTLLIVLRNQIEIMYTLSSRNTTKECIRDSEDIMMDLKYLIDERK